VAGAQEDPERLFSAFWSGGLAVLLFFGGPHFVDVQRINPWWSVGGAAVLGMLAMRFGLAFKRGTSAATVVQQNIAGKNPPIVGSKRRKF
jgi:hypothetical protein